jgi:hypothetical protein
MFANNNNEIKQFKFSSRDDLSKLETYCKLISDLKNILGDERRVERQPGDEKEWRDHISGIIDTYKYATSENFSPVKSKDRADRYIPDIHDAPIHTPYIKSNSFDIQVILTFQVLRSILRYIEHEIGNSKNTKSEYYQLLLSKYQDFYNKSMEGLSDVFSSYRAICKLRAFPDARLLDTFNTLTADKKKPLEKIHKQYQDSSKEFYDRIDKTINEMAAFLDPVELLTIVRILPDHINLKIRCDEIASELCSDCFANPKINLSESDYWVKRDEAKESMGKETLAVINKNRATLECPEGCDNKSLYYHVEKVMNTKIESYKSQNQEKSAPPPKKGFLSGLFSSDISSSGKDDRGSKFVTGSTKLGKK